MSETKSPEINDEIDMRELFLTLWRGKYIVFLVAIVAIAFASFRLRNSEEKYSVQIVLKPVIAGASGRNVPGFSGLASLTGISLPSSSSSDFMTYQKLIFSEEVAEKIFSNKELVVKLFGGEWRSDTQSFEAPPSGNIGKIKQRVRFLLIGKEKRKYIPPNPKRLSMLMDSTFSISLDKGSGFITIETDTSKPDVMVELISNASQETDKLLKERFFVTAEDTLEFYYQKLLMSRSPEHREALAKLISAEDQKLMLASKGSNFVAELLTTPSVSLYPTSPKSSLVLALGFILGIILGSAIVLVRASIKALRAS
ncbi:Wzz/FepE/Etk N-terminal domain-containing protein [Planktomarina sp.]|nr:Wzz/FepE/Etk N-terminal domain-containing protein [Planktomarina sp.]